MTRSRLRMACRPIAAQWVVHRGGCHRLEGAPFVFNLPGDYTHTTLAVGLARTPADLDYRLQMGDVAKSGHVSKQSTSATRIDPLAGRVIPHVAMSQKFVSQRGVSSSALE